MKINFKKIASLTASAVMIGSTIGLAAAATYPDPFVTGGSPNVGVVYGSGAAITDLVAATNVMDNLNTYIVSESTSTSASASGGDFIKVEKSSTKFHIGKGILDVIGTAVTDSSPGDGMPNLLADGEFVDNDNDEFSYTQKINMANLSLTMFEDNDFKEDEPSLGMQISNNAFILNYTLDFTDTPLWEDLATSDITLMGKEYYILSVTENTTMNLLDSASEKMTLGEGETATVNLPSGESFEVRVSFITSDSEAKFEIDGGSPTNSLAAGETQKIDTDTYLGVRSVDYTGKDSGISQVEFAIGKGKLKIVSGNDVELNEKGISNLVGYFTNSASSAGSGLDKVVFEWKADDDLFVADESDVIMPGFGTLKLTYSGMHYPAEEELSIKSGGDTYFQFDNFPLKTSVEDINFIYANSTSYIGIGKDSTNLLRTSNETFIDFDGDTDDYFVASWSDGSDSESYLMRATSFAVLSSSAGTNKTDIQYKKDGTWVSAKDEAKQTDTATPGGASGVELTIGVINKVDKTVRITGGNGNVNFNTLYSAEGMKLYLPWTDYLNATTDTGGMWNVVNDTHVQATFDLIASEEDKNENVANGDNVTLTLGFNSASTPEVAITGVAYSSGSASSTEILNTDVYRNFVYSALGTEVLWNKPSGGQNHLDLIYHGDESFADIFLTDVTAIITGGTSGTGGGTTVGVPILDSEVSSAGTNNLIVLGGSCINTEAASLLGSSTPLCGSDFTAKTDVGAGQYLIETFSRTGGAIATLVAGYNAGDTTNAGTFLTTQLVSTEVGDKYIGTSGTSATMQTTTTATV